MVDMCTGGTRSTANPVTREKDGWRALFQLCLEPVLPQNVKAGVEEIRKRGSWYLMATMEFLGLTRTSRIARAGNCRFFNTFIDYYIP